MAFVTHSAVASLGRMRANSPLQVKQMFDARALEARGRQTITSRAPSMARAANEIRREDIYIETITLTNSKKNCIDSGNRKKIKIRNRKKEVELNVFY